MKVGILGRTECAGAAFGDLWAQAAEPGKPVGSNVLLLAAPAPSNEFAPYP